MHAANAGGTLPALVVRADAGPQLGLGHVMRSLALAQVWRARGGRALVLLGAGTPGLEARLRSEGIEVAWVAAPLGSPADAARSADRAVAEGARWLVVDGYHFGGEYQRRIRARGLAVLAIDDDGRHAHYHADVVLNPNLHATPALYRAREPDTRLLLGSAYALLRREFRAARGAGAPGAPRRAGPLRLLVTMGGADPDNVTARVLEGLERLPGSRLAVRVVVGPANRHRAALETAARHSRHDLQLEVGEPDMPVLLAWADLAVSAAGGTCWELAYFGVPVALVVIADNQEAIARSLVRARASVLLGRATGLSPALVADGVGRLLARPELRRELGRRARHLVDGHGAERAVSALTAT